MLPYLALPRMGFAVPSLLPETRWALTPPFHPYLYCPPHSRGTLLPCGGKVRTSHRRYLSVALSVTSQCPAVNRHPALRGPDFPPDAAFALASSGCLANFPLALYAWDETAVCQRNIRRLHFSLSHRGYRAVARVANHLEKSRRW